MQSLAAQTGNTALQSRLHDIREGETGLQEGEKLFLVCSLKWCVSLPLPHKNVSEV